MTPSEQRHIVETVRKAYAMREICEVLGFNKSTFFYQPKIDPSEEALRAEIQRLATAYPTDGYRHPTKLLVTERHTVGCKRVARLMKAEHLWVSVKRVCQTTRSLEGSHPWVNRLQTLEISRQDQVWVGDITDIRPKGRFISVALLMDGFTRPIRGGQLSQHLTQSLTLKPLEADGHQGGFSRDPPFRSRRAVPFKCVSLEAQSVRYSDFGDA